MIKPRDFLFALMLVLTTMLFIGCNDGPMEEAGETVDETIEDAGEVIEDAGEKLEDAIDESKK